MTILRKRYPNFEWDFGTNFILLAIFSFLTKKRKNFAIFGEFKNTLFFCKSHFSFGLSVGLECFTPLFILGSKVVRNHYLSMQATIYICEPQYNKHEFEPNKNCESIRLALFCFLSIENSSAKSQKMAFSPDWNASSDVSIIVPIAKFRNYACW